MVQTLEGSSRLLLAQLARLRVKLRIYFRRFSLIDLDELFDADRVVAVAIHEGEGLVAFLNSFHLLPVQLLWQRENCLSFCVILGALCKFPLALQDSPEFRATQ